MANETEAHLQITFVQYVGVRYSNDPTFDERLLYHPPNGMYLGNSAARFRHIAKFRAMGMRDGVSDIHYDQPRGKYSKLAIELKREKGGVVSAAQAAYIEALTQAGGYAVVCRGYDAAVAAFDFYMSLPPSGSEKTKKQRRKK